MYIELAIFIFFILYRFPALVWPCCIEAMHMELPSDDDTGPDIALTNEQPNMLHTPTPNRQKTQPKLNHSPFIDEWFDFLGVLTSVWFVMM